MSWDADLVDTDGEELGCWDYTHNTNAMIAAAYKAGTDRDTADARGSLGKFVGPAWWTRLDGRSGVLGKRYLADLIQSLEADPARYRMMNPDNCWGDYDSLLVVLREMRDAVPMDRPTRWRAEG